MAEPPQLFALIGPVIYLLVSSASWLLFGTVLKLLQVGASQVRSVPALQAFAPGVVALNLYMERVFGVAHKFTPNSTQVALLAVLVGLIVHLERIRAAVAARR